MSIAKKSRIRNLMDFHVSKVTANDKTTYTAGVPTHIPGAIKAKITDNFESETMYSDGAVEEVIGEYIDSDIELELSTLSPTECDFFLGQMFENGYLIKTAQDDPPEVAFSFAARRKDNLIEFTQYYCGKFSLSEGQEYETKGDKISTQTRSLKAKFYARQKVDVIDSKNKNLFALIVDEEALLVTDTDAKAAATAWFTTVQEPDLVPGA